MGVTHVTAAATHAVWTGAADGSCPVAARWWSSVHDEPSGWNPATQAPFVQYNVQWLYMTSVGMNTPAASCRVPLFGAGT